MANFPSTDKEFTVAANSIATAFLDKFATMGAPPNDVANLVGAALSTVLANQLGPFGAVERLRDLADNFERQLLDGLN